MKHRPVKLIALLLLTLLLNSCSIKIAYNFLDSLLGWQVSRYVTLKGEQKSAAKTIFKDFHLWHRRTQLKDYAEYLTYLKKGIMEDQVDPTFLHEASDKLQDMLDTSMIQLLPGLTQIAATLSDKQIDEVTKNLTQKRKKYRKEYIEDDRDAVQRRRIKDLTRYIGPFFGSFTHQQKQRLKDWENRLSPYEELLIKQQEQWQADFLKAMEYRQTPNKLKEKLSALVLYRTDNWNEKLQKRLDTNQTLTYEMMANLFNSRSQQQRKKTEKKLNHYIEILLELNAKG